MKQISITILALLGIVAADVSHLGYHYKTPQTSYGTPSYQVGLNNGGFNSGFSSGGGIHGQGSGQYYQDSLSSSFNTGSKYPSGGQYQQLGSVQYTSGSKDGFHSGGSGSTGGSYQSASGGGSNGYYSGTLGQNNYQTGQYHSGGPSGGTTNVQFDSNPSGGYQSSFNQFQSSSQSSNSQNIQQQYDIVQQPAQVFKHFYVHAAPEEPEIPKPRVPIVLPPPEKHYKIIFIKTPHQAPSSSHVYPVQQQNEEKTIVYVLYQKPEEIQNVQVPKFTAKTPTKPEVFFIKYAGKEGAQGVINNIVNDYNKVQGQVSYSGTESSGNTNSGSYVSGGQSSGQSNHFVSGSSDSGSNQVVLTDSYGSGHGSSSSEGFAGSTFGSTPSVNFVSIGDTSSSGSHGGSSNTGSFESSSSSGKFEVSTSQGVPHESYGPPFKA